MQKEENTNVLNKDMIGIILSLVWPTMLEQLMQTTVQYIDTAMVGTFICTQCWGLGLVSAWACMILHNLLLFVLFLISYLRGSWNPLYKS